jgi:hypothetical protein
VAIGNNVKEERERKKREGEDQMGEERFLFFKRRQ